MASLLTPPLRSELQKIASQVRFDEPMAEHTTFHIGGPADVYAEAGNLKELEALLNWAKRREVPFFLMGWGSNLLVLDGGIRGLVIRLAGEFQQICQEGEAEVYAGAAVRLPALVSFCAGRGLSGLQALTGIPGTVGGALVMNAGTPEGQIGDFVSGVWAWDEGAGKARELGSSQVHFGYRQSSLGGMVLLGVRLKLKRDSKDAIIAATRELQARRTKAQPVRLYNAGSIFKNPSGDYAARLIESAGLKGARSGDAQVSEQHANFIVNLGRARAREVLDLIEKIRSAVRKIHQVDLELEVQVVGSP